MEKCRGFGGFDGTRTRTRLFSPFAPAVRAALELCVCVVDYACVYAMQVIDTWMHRVVVASWTIGLGVAPRSLLFVYMQRGLLCCRNGGLVRYLACAAVRAWCKQVGKRALSFIDSLRLCFWCSWLCLFFLLPWLFHPFAGWLFSCEASRFSCAVFPKNWDSGFFFGSLLTRLTLLPVFPFRRLFSLVCPFAFPRGPDRLMWVPMQKSK